MSQWNFDPAHSAVEFTARHMMVTNVRGHVKGITGTLNFDPNQPEKTSVDVSIDIATLSTGVADRDNHLRSADFFDVANHPKVTFKSTKVQVSDKTHARLTGDLTIRGVTRPVTLDVEFLGEATSPYGDKRVGFEARASLNRENWGLTWNVALEAGGVLVGKEIKLALDVEAILVQEPALAR